MDDDLAVDEVRKVEGIAARLPAARELPAVVDGAEPAWTLHSAEWELLRPMRAGGRPARADYRVRVAPRAPGGRNLAASFWVSIQLPWIGRGLRPRWVKDGRAALSRQLRAAGLSVQWFAAAGVVTPGDPGL